MSILLWHPPISFILTALPSILNIQTATARLYCFPDVKDLAYQEYAIPHQSMSDSYHQSPSTPGRAPPPLQNFLPKPPPVPPPPEQYYAATEICNAGYIPPPPPLSTPPAVRVSSVSKSRRPRQNTASPRKYVGP